MKVGFYTLGCKVNQYETSLMIEQFESNKYDIVDFKDKADIYVINTCTVTNMSDRKSRQMIQKAKKGNEDSIIVVVGCLAQVAKEELEKIPQIDLVLGNEEKKNIVTYVEKFMKDKNIKSYVQDIMKQETYLNDQLKTIYERTRAIVKIQDGCNNYCTYCIIPYARGKIRSKLPENVINEIKSIVENGYKEVVLTGIHICSYGRDLGNISLIDLLEKINDIPGLQRIRLGSLEPNNVTEDFLCRAIKLDKLCPHFHLSLQSGCDETLKRMNRKYTTEDIYNIVKNIRKYYPDANLTTDIIVGFPGETDEEFNITKKFLEKIELNKMHIFQYSRRKGTVADKMPNQISPEKKKERSNILLKMSNENENKFLSKFINTEVEILVEEDDNGIRGFTKNYIYVQSSKNVKNNEMVKLKIKEVKGNILIGE